MLKQDPTTQNVLASFIGAFLFSLVGIIALSSDVYTDSGRFILFIATLMVLTWIIVALLRWIEHLSELGQLSNTMNLVTSTVRASFAEHARSPALGCNPLPAHGELPEDANLVRFNQVGHIQHVDLDAISRIAEQAGTEIGLLVGPGALIQPGRVVAWYKNQFNEELESALEDAFTLSMERSYDQDPRFGVSVLTEIASRALSPGVNDPGTAIAVIHRHLELLLDHSRLCHAEQDNIVYTRLYLPTLSMEDVFADAFEPIARDGAAIFEVQIRLQKTLKTLAAADPQRFAIGAKSVSRTAMDYVESSNMLESQKSTLRQLADSI